MTLPRDAEVLAQFPQSPAMALMRKGGSAFLLVNFDVMDTNWPFENSFMIFCYNATTYLGSDMDSGQDNSLRVGQPITLAGFSPNLSGKLSGPGFDGKTIRSDGSGAFRYPGTDRAGLYRLAVPARAPAFFAVNLLDAQESHIDPLKQVTLSGVPVKASSAQRAGNLELWPYLAMLALLLACAEWVIYNHRAKL